MTVWELETESQKAAINDLNRIVGFALQGHRKSQNYLKKLWPECDWQTIKERLQTESSAWYVWWMDGINIHLQSLLKNVEIVEIEI